MSNTELEKRAYEEADRMHELLDKINQTNNKKLIKDCKEELAEILSSETKEALMRLANDIADEEIKAKIIEKIETHIIEDVVPSIKSIPTDKGKLEWAMECKKRKNKHYNMFIKRITFKEKKLLNDISYKFTRAKEIDEVPPQSNPLFPTKWLRINGRVLTINVPAFIGSIILIIMNIVIISLLVDSTAWIFPAVMYVALTYITKLIIDMIINFKKGNW